MGTAAVLVDVQAVRRIVDDVSVCPQRIEHSLCTGAGGAVGAVQCHLHALEGLGGQGNEIADVAVPSCREVHGAADPIPAGQRHLRGSAVQVVLNFRNHVIGELLAVLIDDLDAVVIVGVVGGRDHNAAVKILRSHNVAYGRGGGHMHQIRIGSRRRNARRNGVLKHIAGTPGVLADHDTALLALLQFFLIVPAQELTHAKGAVRCQNHIGLSPVSVCSEIFTHYFSVL